MFNVSLQDVAPPPRRNTQKRFNDNPFDDFDTTDALSAFIDDDVDFIFPENGGKVPPLKNGQFDDDSLMSLQNLQWNSIPDTKFNPIQSNGGDDFGKDFDIKKSRGLMTASDDFLGVLASKISPVDVSTTEIFDSEDEYYSDDGSLGSEYDNEDIKPVINNNFICLNGNNALHNTVLNPSIPQHMNFSRPEFDLELLHGTPSSNSFKIDNNDIKPGGRSRKRRKISAEEKVELTRQRNREHARSTRRRKKMYVECLKKQVAELLAKQRQIDSGNFEPMSATHTEEISIARRAVLRKFLKYRTSNVVDPGLWNELIDESFVFLQPRTPFRAANIGRVIGNSRRIKGLESVIHDTASISAMLEMITSRARQQKPGMRKNITMSYNIDPSDILVVGDRLMCHWTLSTANLVEAGFASECSIDGMLKCTFNSKNVVLKMEITYDVMAFTSQLQKYSLIDLSVVTQDVNVSTRSDTTRNSISPSCKGNVPFRQTRNNLPIPSLVPNFKMLKQPNGARSNAKGSVPGLLPNLMNLSGSMLPMMQLAGLQQMKIQLPTSMSCTNSTTSGTSANTNGTNLALGKTTVSAKPVVTVPPIPSPVMMNTKKPCSPVSVSASPVVSRQPEIKKEIANPHKQQPFTIPRDNSSLKLPSGNSGSNQTMNTNLLLPGSENKNRIKNVPRGIIKSNSMPSFSQTPNKVSKQQMVFPMMPSMILPTRKPMTVQPWNVLPGMMQGLMPMPPFITPTMFPVAQPGHMLGSQLKRPGNMGHKTTTPHI